MRILSYIEIENFKSFSGLQRIPLNHPAVLIGPNNCGKTSVIQAVALWSQAIRTWYSIRKDSSASERTATPLNRLNIISVPVQKTRYFWHNTRVQSGIQLSITVGVVYKNKEVPIKILFKHKGDELLYCEPDESIAKDFELIKFAASINVELLYPMSGLTTEEPVLKPGRINVLLGQGETAQVLRNLCLSVAKDSIADWQQIVLLMNRLFFVRLKDPVEAEARGSIDLFYEQEDVKEELDISMSGRGFQQILLIFAYLFSHKNSVLLIDEPDAHLEILRQRQVYILLRDIADQNKSQVIIVTHSEVILDEALDHNLTLLLNGQANDLAEKKEIRATLKQYGAEHYVKARDRGYVLYVEGSTDLDMLKAFAERLNHPVLTIWDDKTNVYYIQDTYPEQSLESELERVEGGFGVTPKDHFMSLKKMIRSLRGAGILDNDGKERANYSDGGLTIQYWHRYEAENYFITPELLENYAESVYSETLFNSFRPMISEVMGQIVQGFVFNGSSNDYETYRKADKNVARLIWESKTERLKLSSFAEEYFYRLSKKINLPILLEKGSFHRLIALVKPSDLSPEIGEKLSLLEDLFKKAI